MMRRDQGVLELAHDLIRDSRTQLILPRLGTDDICVLAEDLTLAELDSRADHRAL
jgi:hypothetical protein